LKLLHFSEQGQEPKAAESTKLENSSVALFLGIGFTDEKAKDLELFTLAKR